MNRIIDLKEIKKQQIRQNRLIGQLRSSVEKNCSVERIKFLHLEGADIRMNGDFCLHTAVYNLNVEAVKYLIENGCDYQAYDNFAITHSSKHGNIELVEYLISKYPEDKEIMKSAALHSVKNNQIDLLDHLIKNYAHFLNKEALSLEAVFYGQLKPLQYLLNKGVDINTDNSLLLYQSCIGGKAEITHYLIENGCVVNEEDIQHILYVCINKSLDYYKSVSIDDDERVNNYEIQNDGHFSILKIFKDIKLMQDIVNEKIIKSIKIKAFDMIQYLLEHGANSSLLLQNGDKEMHNWYQKIQLEKKLSNKEKINKVKI